MSTYELDNRRKIRRMLILTFIAILILFAIFLIVYGSFKSKQSKTSNKTEQNISQNQNIPNINPNADLTKNVIFSIQENVDIKNSRCENIRTHFVPKPTVKNNTQVGLGGGYQLYSGEVTETNVDQYSNNKDCKIFVTTPKVYSKIYKNIAITGYIFSDDWRTGDNVIAEARLFDANDKPLSIGVPVKITNNESDGVSAIRADITFDGQTIGEQGYIDITRNDLVKGLKYIHRIPVSFK